MKGDEENRPRYPAGMTRPFHLAFPVHDLAAARAFYGGTLGCAEGRSSDGWIDFDLYGHQIVAHLDPAVQPVATTNPVDGHDVPVPHFGVVLTMPDWQALADRLTAAGTRFGIAPHIRFVGQPGEQATMFFYDPFRQRARVQGVQGRCDAVRHLKDRRLSDPITLDIPHKLGREAAKARIGGGIGKLAEMFPGGAAVDHRWEGDTMHFTVAAMGQRVASRLTVSRGEGSCRDRLAALPRALRRQDSREARQGSAKAAGIGPASVRPELVEGPVARGAVHAWGKRCFDSPGSSPGTNGNCAAKFFT